MPEIVIDARKASIGPGLIANRILWGKDLFGGIL